MKKVLLGLLISLLLATSSWAVGVATVTGYEIIHVVNQRSRVILTITFVDDNAGTTLAINPVTYDITGWYLYSVETNPGATAPTDNYDITLIDSDGADLAGGTLMNRDTATTEFVNIGMSSIGFPVIRGTFTFTLSGNAVVGGTGIVIMTFLAN